MKSNIKTHFHITRNETADSKHISKIGGLKVSPDGTHALYAATVPDPDADEFRTSLWIVDLKKETESPLSQEMQHGISHLPDSFGLGVQSLGAQRIHRQKS